MKSFGVTSVLFLTLVLASPSAGEAQARQVLQPSARCSDQPDAAIATFEDANLEARVRSALSVSPQQDLTCGLVSGLTRLEANRAGIESLIGIQNLSSLTELRLDRNSITDISPLSELTSLKAIDLDRNSITDISPLSGLTSLTNLDLNRNSITDISALSGLTSLTRLDLGRNSSSDISVLSGLTSLTELSLYEDSITDVSALSGLTSLTRLDLDGNSITDFSALSGLTGLTFLDLEDNLISDISPLSGLTSLTTLDLQENSVTDVSVLRGLTSLTLLDLDNNSITDISALSGLTSLTILNLRRNSITDISALSGLTSLTSIDLNGNSITDVSAFGGLTSLTTLVLWDNAITDISPLSGLTSLAALDLDRNSITDINALSGLTSLTELFLSANAITDISAVSGLTSLTTLSLGNNSIRDISVLSGLTSLELLRLPGNSGLTDFRALLGNAGLGPGATVDLRSTGMSCADVATLKAKGVSVICLPEAVPHTRTQPSANIQADMVITNARIIDGTGTVIEQGVVVIQDGHIVSVSPGPATTPTTEVIDANGMTLMPGMIDTHRHLLTRAPVDNDEALDRWIEYEMPGLLQELLAKGLTTVMSVAGLFPEILEVRKRIEEGTFLGPRLLVVGPAFTAPDDHPATTVARNNPYRRAKLAIEVSDPEVARARVRELAAAGVDGIKAVYDRIIVRDAQLDEAVLSAISEETKQQGLPLLVHAETVDAMLTVVNLGADRLVHSQIVGSIAQGPGARILREGGIPISTTVSWTSRPLSEAVGRAYTAERRARARHRQILANIRHLMDEGVTVAFGTDSPPPLGRAEFLVEVQELNTVLSPEEIITALTRNAAAFLDLDDEIGTLEPGKIADIVMIDGDPLADISALANVMLVIKNGKVVVDHR